MTISSTAVYQVRPTGVNTNGGGYDAGISGAGTDYTQQVAAQVSGTHGTLTGGGVVFVDATANSFTAAMVGNSINISAGTGTGFTAGIYFVVSYTSASTVNLDRTPSTGNLTAATWALGGSWRDFSTNASAYNPGNTIMVYGSGSNYPTVADYTYGGYFVCPSGDNTNGRIRFIGMNGRPRVDTSGLVFQGGNLIDIENFAVTFTYASGSSGFSNGSQANYYNCFFDQAGYDATALAAVTGSVAKCEFVSSVAPKGAQTNAALTTGGYGAVITNNFFHDTNGPAIAPGFSSSIVGNVFANCRKEGIILADGNVAFGGLISGNTFDSNGGNGGISITTNPSLNNYAIINNIITDHATAGQGGIKFTGAATTAQASKIINVISFNWFYGNAADASGFTLPSGYGNSTGVSPAYAGAAAENYTPGTALSGAVMPFPTNALSGKTNMTNSQTPGAIQNASTGGTVGWVSA